LKIVIETIPHSEHRYPTCGDYWVDRRGVLQVRVSKLKDWRWVALIIIHELWEYFIVRHQKIPLKAIDRFDKEFERNWEKHDHSEPGDSPQAPYRVAHCSATGVERLLASELDVCWFDYEFTVDQLP
jgi:hypothetical protein